jgi:archaellum component FlaC
VKAFKVFLTKNKLLTDKEGQVRTLYSLRHTYATTRLRQGTSWDDLAIQMGTSRAMLERHYSKFKVEDRAAEFSGLEEKRRKQLAKEKSELEKARKTIDTLQKTVETLNQTIKALLSKVKKKARKTVVLKKSGDSKSLLQKH